MRLHDTWCIYKNTAEFEIKNTLPFILASPKIEDLGIDPTKYVNLKMSYRPKCNKQNYKIPVR